MRAQVVYKFCMVRVRDRRLDVPSELMVCLSWQVGLCHILGIASSNTQCRLWCVYDIACWIHPHSVHFFEVLERLKVLTAQQSAAELSCDEFFCGAAMVAVAFEVRGLISHVSIVVGGALCRPHALCD